MMTPPDNLSATLQRARQARRISQLELSLRLQVSQRHISFVESGRAKPSRELLLTWLQNLHAPMALQNAAMLQAGFAPIYTQAPLVDPYLAGARQALDALITAHNPMPAFVLDAHWNILQNNRAGEWLLKTLLPDFGFSLMQKKPDAAINLIDLIIHPKGLTQCWVNFDETGPPLLAKLRDEASAQPQLRPKAEALAALINNRYPNLQTQSVWPVQSSPVLTTRWSSKFGELSFFSTFTTFGTPQDITLASLKVEHLFAADSHTEGILRRELKASG